MRENDVPNIEYSVFLCTFMINCFMSTNFMELSKNLFDGETNFKLSSVIQMWNEEHSILSRGRWKHWNFIQNINET